MESSDRQARGESSRSATIQTLLLAHTSSSLSRRPYFTMLCPCIYYFELSLLQEYRILAVFNAALHILAVALELFQVIELTGSFNSVRPALGLVVLTFSVTVLAFVNAVICLWLVFSLTKQLCIYSVLCSLVSMILFVIILIYGSLTLKFDSPDEHINLSVNIVQLVIQLFPMVIMYRFWEYLTFNHDFESSLGSSSSNSSLGSFGVNSDTAVLRNSLGVGSTIKIGDSKVVCIL